MTSAITEKFTDDRRQTGVVLKSNDKSQSDKVNGNGNRKWQLIKKSIFYN